ncbi:glycosyltransferase [Alteromonas sp. McT4-15]|uniref:glycosyltransferase n=1 Tax=Alteromonas sp. McT4-15 TaxID=2881256 RepID=UPI001CF8643C|nr:glycosyltransferase [Alteromonas sp. McT4-15]MCB4438243.1 glycosyltransferase [Alteromonas sp. McT4-15]
MDISIIIPSFNALGKLERCLTSLRNQTMDASQYEVIFVDDCSTDGTFNYLQEQAAQEPNWRVLQLEQNSGSPSKPRNEGTAAARGEYVFFLDCDDEIIADTLEIHHAHAKATDACIVRGYLIADDGQHHREMNRLVNWQSGALKKAKIETLLSRQSTTVSSLIKRTILTDNGVVWPEDIRVGEDSLFLVNLLCHCEVIEYLDHPTFIYNKRASFRASSTQEYGQRELSNHLHVWRRLISTLQELDIDYATLRLRIGLQTSINSLIHHGKNDLTHQDFLTFSDFITEFWTAISKHKFAPRVSAILQTLLSRDFQAFQEECKPRLLIAGHDLKFILPHVDILKIRYSIKIDEWTGHDMHDPQKSEKLLEWADYIWCEWLLGNAVWYSKRKKSHQKLVVRMHRFELGRDFGEKVNVENVDAFVAVSVLFFERLLERFPNLKREKVRLIHNVVDAGNYQLSKSSERIFNIAMIGIVPSRKGFLDALKLIKMLKEKDERYKLKVFGKSPSDLPWLSKHEDEMSYYSECTAFISENNLDKSIEFLGHVNIKEALALHNVGYVLSLSHDERGFPGPESFHLAITDGIAAGADSLIKYWSGAEYIHEKNRIFNSIEHIRDHIINTKNRDGNDMELKKSQEFVKRYDEGVFVNAFNELFRN